MKKLSFLLLGIAISLQSIAQQSKVVATWNYLGYYERNEGADNLDKARQNIDEAAANESTGLSGKTWWYRAKTYQYLFLDSVKSPANPNALDEAIASYKKIIELDDKKFRDWQDFIKNIQILSAPVFNAGVSAYQASSFKEAYRYFSAISDLDAIVTAKGGKLPIDGKTATANAALAAEQAKMYKEAIAVYDRLIAQSPEMKYYILKSRAHKEMGDKEGAMKTLDDGIAKLPKEIELIIEKLNFYIADDMHEKAIDMINSAIALDPKNDQLYYALGTAYDKLNNEESSKAAYEKCVELNPKNFNAWYNLGAMYFNKAGKINDEINALGYSKADQEKEKVLKAKRAELFIKAKPFFEKALEVSPDDAAVKKALYQINNLAK